jgi:hypothetical protein
MCSQCAQLLCFKCTQPWHGDTACIDDVRGGSKDFERFQEKNDSRYKRCPNCATPIEKRDGCNHMDCTVCKVHFCWDCKKDITKEKYEHFQAVRVETSYLKRVHRLFYPNEARCVLFNSDRDSRAHFNNMIFALIVSLVHPFALYFFLIQIYQFYNKA